MRPFEYRKVASTAGAIALAAERRDALYLAGGTEVVNWLKDGIVAPTLLIDLTACEFDRVALDGDTLSIGGLARMATVAADPAVRQTTPAVAQAIEAAASPAIRAMATIAGNLLQRTRCPYFLGARHPALGNRHPDLRMPSAEPQVPHSEPCNRREAGSGCAVLTGDQEAAAILGASPGCVATHPSDLAVVLVALEAELVVQGEAGRRIMPAEALWPAIADPAVENTLLRGELITAVRVPIGRAAGRTRYLKIRRRASFEFASVAAAGYCLVEDGVVADARLGFGGVAARPWRARTAEAHLIGRPPTAESVARAVAAELANAAFLPGNRSKADQLVAAATRVLIDPLELR